jgi:hypothetical protein
MYVGTDGSGVGEEDGNRDWLMEMDCGGYDFHHTDGFVQSAVIGREVFRGRVEEVGAEDFVTSLSLSEVREAITLASLSEAEGCGTMARVAGDVAGAGEFSGTAGIKGRPLTMEAKPLDTEHANLERHHAAFATDPADPTSGEAQGDEARS